jgi:hypothetical protein
MMWPGHRRAADAQPIGQRLLGNQRLIAQDGQDLLFTLGHKQKFIITNFCFPIVRVFHVDGPKVASNPFSIESGFVQPLAELHAFDPVATFFKSRHSALVGTGLDVWLTQHGIQTLIISGIRTEQCCETTARHASDLGWKVDYCLDATLTWDMQQLDGRALCAADIKARTATVLQDRFASICSVTQALERTAQPAMAK